MDGPWWGEALVGTLASLVGLLVVVVTAWARAKWPAPVHDPDHNEVQAPGRNREPA